MTVLINLKVLWLRRTFETKLAAIGVARGRMAPKILSISKFVLKKWYSKQNTVALIKSNSLAPSNSGLATPLLAATVNSMWSINTLFYKLSVNYVLYKSLDYPNIDRRLEKLVQESPFVVCSTSKLRFD